MKKNDLLQFATGTARYVAAHASVQSGRNRNPSAAYQAQGGKQITEPRAALAAARRELMSTPTALQLLGEVIVHLDMDADRNGSKKRPGSNQGGMGRINATRGLIERIRTFTKDQSNTSPEVHLLRQIEETVVSTAMKGQAAYGVVPANGGVARQAEQLIRSQLGPKWLGLMTAGMAKVHGG